MVQTDAVPAEKANEFQMTAAAAWKTFGSSDQVRGAAKICIRGRAIERTRTAMVIALDARNQPGPSCLRMIRASTAVLSRGQRISARRKTSNRRMGARNSGQLNARAASGFKL